MRRSVPRISLRACTLVLSLVAGVASVACHTGPPALRLATTTSVDDSGLLDALRSEFEAAHGVRLQVIAVGSGQAFQLGRRGDVGLLLTHEPIGERALVEDGLVQYYRKVMFNHFVIAGPSDDPAGVGRAASTADAMRRIAASGAPFVSRGDDSGTHAREQQLWTLAGARPGGGKLIETGQGMAPTLRVASQRAAYVLTDKATLMRLSGAITVTPLFSDESVLTNTYAVLRLSTAPDESEALAVAFTRWLTGEPGRAIIDGFRVDGQQAFFSWPAGADAASPESLPESAKAP